MPKLNLCDKCGRPLWESLCGYCKGYIDGVVDTKARKINQEIVSIEKVTLKEGEKFPSVEGIPDKDINYIK